MEKNEPDILSYLLTDKYFRDSVLNSNGKTNGSLKEWFTKHPGSAPDVTKASAYLKGITFQVNRLLPDELDELLDDIYANE